MEPGDQQERLARQPRPLEGLPAPLFERLLAGNPDFSGPPAGGRILDRKAVLASVGRELERLFGTRLASAPAPVPAGFGVRDWGAVNPASPAELEALAGELAAKATVYEPRLELVRVELWQDPAHRRRVRGALTARLRLDWTLEPVTFLLAIDTARFTVQPEHQETSPEESSKGESTCSN